MCVPVYNLYIDFSVDERSRRTVRPLRFVLFARRRELKIYSTAYFSYISSTSYVVSFLGPTLASFTMSRNLWLPFWLNIALLACAVPIIGLLPSLAVKTIATGEIICEAEEVGPLLESRSASPPQYTIAFETQPSVFKSILSAVRKMRVVITSRANFQILLFSMFLTSLASSDTRLLVQYISKRYEWTFAQAGYMLSAKAIVNFTLLVLIVPRLSIWCRPHSKRMHGAGVWDSFVLARASIFVSVLGVLCVALAARFWMLLGGE
jgi:hypothetical protein